MFFMKIPGELVLNDPHIKDLNYIFNSREFVVFTRCVILSILFEVQMK